MLLSNRDALEYYLKLLLLNYNWYKRKKDRMITSHLIEVMEYMI